MSSLEYWEENIGGICATAASQWKQFLYKLKFPNGAHEYFLRSFVGFFFVSYSLPALLLHFNWKRMKKIMVKNTWLCIWHAIGAWIVCCLVYRCEWRTAWCQILWLFLFISYSLPGSICMNCFNGHRKGYFKLFFVIGKRLKIHSLRQKLHHWAKKKI